MKKLYNYLPELEGDEAIYIENQISNMREDDIEIFCKLYGARRKDPILFLILALIGFFGVAGLHRFIIGHIGLGILYVFTAGLCLIGTVVDMVNYKNLAFEYNRNKALEVKGEIGL